MTRTVLRIVVITIVCGAGILALGVPMGLYMLGISNIQGRPEPPIETNHITADTVLLQQTFRSPSPVSIHVLNPWTYAATLLNEDPKDIRLDTGSHATWLIARDYNSKHLKNRWVSSWHLSGAALMIWLSRNWTTEEIVTAAADIARPKAGSVPTSAIRCSEAATRHQGVVREATDPRATWSKSRTLCNLIGRRVLVRSAGPISTCADASSLQVSGFIRRVNFKTAYPPPPNLRAGFWQAKSSIALMAFDCKDHRQRIDQSRTYYTDGRVEPNSVKDPVLWDPVGTDTVAAADLDLVCGWNSK
jgi:hypothetical protein